MLIDEYACPTTPRARRAWEFFTDWAAAREIRYLDHNNRDRILSLFDDDCAGLHSSTIRKVIRRAQPPAVGSKVFADQIQNDRSFSVQRAARDLALLGLAHHTATPVEGIVTLSLVDHIPLGLLVDALPRDDLPTRCERCWAVAWMRIRWAYLQRGRAGAWLAEAQVHDALYLSATHVCGVSFGVAHGRDGSLFVAIDRHNWMSSAPLSSRSERAIRAKWFHPETCFSSETQAYRILGSKTPLIEDNQWDALFNRIEAGLLDLSETIKSAVNTAEADLAFLRAVT